jgi:regulator of replication initiation timing
MDIAEQLRLLPEPQCRPCKAAADEIEMLRQQWREMSSAMMELRRENLHLKQELADSKRWAMSERAAKWDALAKYDTGGER